MLAVSVASLPRSRLARLFAGGHLLAALALRRRWRGQALPRAPRLAAQVLFLQATAIGALLRFARRESLAAWPKHGRGEASLAAFSRAERPGER